MFIPLYSSLKNLKFLTFSFHFVNLVRKVRFLYLESSFIVLWFAIKWLDLVVNNALFLLTLMIKVLRKFSTLDLYENLIQVRKFQILDLRFLLKVSQDLTQVKCKTKLLIGYKVQNCLMNSLKCEWFENCFMWYLIDLSTLLSIFLSTILDLRLMGSGNWYNFHHWALKWSNNALRLTTLLCIKLRIYMDCHFWSLALLSIPQCLNNPIFI